MHHSLIRSSLSLLGLALVAHAQNGVIDQVSPYPGTAQTAGFNGDAASLIWQQEVQAGVAGKLEGVELLLNGTGTSTIDVRLRAGVGWNTGPVLVQATVTQSSSNPPTVFVDFTSANLQLAAGDKFVIELQGNGSGCGFLGTYAPPPAAAQYPNFLFLGGPGCFADCGWRMAFTSYMLPPSSAPVTYCTSGTTTSGCAATINATANPNVAHTTPCTINVTGVEGQKTGIVFYGLQQLPQLWCASGTSFLCVKAPTMRTIGQNSGGSTGACNGQLTLDWNAFQTTFPGSLGNPWTAGDEAYVQGWFRDPTSCKTTSLSNAVILTYQP